jgi:hypothetical protein
VVSRCLLVEVDFTVAIHVDVCNHLIHLCRGRLETKRVHCDLCAGAGGRTESASPISYMAWSAVCVPEQQKRAVEGVSIGNSEGILLSGIQREER